MKKWIAGSILVHHKKELKLEVHDLANDLMQIISARKGNVEFILWCIGLPAFLLLSNVANFATADKEAQVFKAGTLNYYRASWLRGIYEKYWYDPQLADFENKPIDQVIASNWKIKALFEDLVYDTRLDTINAEKILVEVGAHDEIDVLEKLGEDDIIAKKKAIIKLQAEDMQNSIDEVNEKAQAEGRPPFKPGRVDQDITDDQDVLE
jgi:hypothetical protein